MSYAGSLARSASTVIFINQLRSKIGVIYGNPEVTAGGNALKFYASLRLDIRRKEIHKDNGGVTAKVKVVKNKIAPPFRVVELDILFGSGLDRTGCLLDAGEACGVLTRRGAYIYRGELRLGQGKRQAAELLKSDEKLAAEIDAEVRRVIAAGQASGQSHPHLLVEVDDENAGLLAGAGALPAHEPEEEVSF